MRLTTATATSLSLWLTSAVVFAQVPAPAARVAPVAPTAKAAGRPPAASTVRLPQSDIALDLPKGWTAERTSETNESHTLMSPDGVTTLLVFSVAAKDTEAGLSDLDRTLQGMITDATLETPVKGTVGGMPALMADGSGKVDGHAVELGLLLVFNEAAQRVVFMIGFSLPGKGETYAEDLAALLRSVRRGA